MKSTLLALGACSLACSTPQLAVDKEFATHADVLHPEVKKDAESPKIAFGPFVVEYLAPVTSSTLKSPDHPPIANHRFAFELKDGAAEAWDVSCDVNMRWVGPDKGSSIQELNCDISNAGTSEGKLPYRMTVSGTGATLGLKTGSVIQGEPVLDIQSSHGDPGLSRAIGPLLGFDITHDNLLMGTVQTVEPLTIWIDNAGPQSLRSLTAACAVALAFYEKLSTST